MRMLREIYHGNARGFDSRQYEKGSPFMVAVHKRQDAKDRLFEGLSDEQKEIFEQYEEAASSVHSITNYDT